MFYLFVILGTSFIVIEALMILCWVFYLIRRNVNLIDFGWEIGFMAAALVGCILGDGFFWRKILVLILVSVWALRLMIYTGHRFVPERDDPRYALVLNWWPFARLPLFQIFTLYVFQGLVITVLSLPFALMNQNLLPFFSSYEVFGLLIWMLGISGEGIAKRQYEQFKQDASHTNRVCDQGLWKYSRFPNYFFEWIVWIGYGWMALSSPLGWLGLIAPLLMLYLLLNVSGIPLSETQSLITQGDIYRDYQSRTSSFFPWFCFKSSVESKKQEELTEKE